MNIHLLKQSPLFEGIPAGEAEKLLSCLNPVLKECERNDIILSAGDAADNIYLILSGSVRVIEADFAGNTSIISEHGAGEVFCAEYALAQFSFMPVSVRVSEPSEILLLNFRKIMSPCESACQFHTRLILNLTRMLAASSISCQKKLQVLSQRTIRDKLYAYLDQHARLASDNQFTIPLNRAQLAKFLCVDRSAMSRELCKMRDEGLIEFYKNAFILKADE